MKLAKRPRVVIIGGSFAGLCTGRNLRKTADVLIIETKDYFEYAPSIPHLLCGSNSFDKLVIPLFETTDLVGMKHLQAHFIGFKPQSKKIIVRKELDYLELDYDVLVICSGVSYSSPIRTHLFSRRERIAEYQSFAKKIINTSVGIVVTGVIHLFDLYIID